MSACDGIHKVNSAGRARPEAWLCISCKSGDFHMHVCGTHARSLGRRIRQLTVRALKDGCIKSEKS